MSQGHQARARASVGLYARARALHTRTPGANREAVLEVSGFHGRAPAVMQPVGTATAQHGKQSARHVGKIDTIEKIWQKMANMASEEEPKSSMRWGIPAAKFLSKQKQMLTDASFVKNDKKHAD